MKLYVRGPGTDETRARLDGASMVATRTRPRGLRPRSRSRAFALWSELSAKGARRAGELAERRALRGFDAIHLASALEVEQLTGSTPSFCCVDDRLREAASGEGLPV